MVNRSTQECCRFPSKLEESIQAPKLTNKRERGEIRERTEGKNQSPTLTPPDRIEDNRIIASLSSNWPGPTPLFIQNFQKSCLIIA